MNLIGHCVGVSLDASSIARIYRIFSLLNVSNYCKRSLT
jgi:hypothetical protein